MLFSTGKFMKLSDVYIPVHFSPKQIATTTLQDHFFTTINSSSFTTTATMASSKKKLIDSRYNNLKFQKTPL